MLSTAENMKNKKNPSSGQTGNQRFLPAHILSFVLFFINKVNKVQ